MARHDMLFLGGFIVEFLELCCLFFDDALTL